MLLFLLFKLSYPVFQQLGHFWSLNFMEYFNQTANFGISVTRGEYFIGRILTLANPLYVISVRSKLFCYHSEIIKKLTFNVEFNADLV